MTKQTSTAATTAATTAALVLTACSTLLAADGPSLRDRYFDGLRQRGLFSLAESVCFEELAQDNLDADARLDSTLQLSHTLVQHAQATAGSQQDDLWNRARSVLVDFSNRHPNHDEQLRVQVQTALIALARGGYLARLADLAPLDRRRRGKALTTLQHGIDQLAPLGRRLENSSSLPRDRRQLLLATSRWRLARAHLDRVRMMTPGTPDRAADLIAADRILKRMSSGGLGTTLKHSRSRLRAQVARLGLDFTSARRLLDTKNSPNNDGLLAERVWIELDDQKPSTAWSLVQTRLDHPPPPSDELLYLAQATLGQLWQNTQADTPQADQLWTTWLVASERATAVPDAYWKTRAVMDHTFLVAVEQLGPELAKGQHRAVSLYQAQRNDEALEAFAQVIRIAKQHGRTNLAGDLAFTRGSLMVRSQRYAEASRSFRNIVDQTPPHPRSASAHLLWAWCLGQVDRQQTNPKRRQAYQQALQAHTTRFAKHPTAVEAIWLLAELEHQMQHGSAARRLWSQIPDSHTRAKQARRRISESLEEDLAGMDQDEPNTHRQLESAVSQVEQLVARLPRPPETWSIEQAALAISLARLRLKPIRPDYARVDQLLEMVLQQGPQPDTRKPKQQPASLRDTARQLRVLSLAGQGRLDDARQLIATFAGRPAELLALLDGLDRVAVTTRPSDRRRLGELQLQAAVTLATQRNSLGPDDIRRLDRCMAQAYVAAGLPERAVHLYQELVRITPRDWQLRVRLAEIRVAIGSAKHLELANTDWQLAERLLKAGGDDWINVRIQRLRTLMLAGQTEPCRQLFAVTQLLYPNSGTPAAQANLKRIARQLPPSRP